MWIFKDDDIIFRYKLTTLSYCKEYFFVREFIMFLHTTAWTWSYLIRSAQSCFLRFFTILQNSIITYSIYVRYQAAYGVAKLCEISTKSSAFLQSVIFIDGNVDVNLHG